MSSTVLCVCVLNSGVQVELLLTRCVISSSRPRLSITGKKCEELPMGNYGKLTGMSQDVVHVTKQNLGQGTHYLLNLWTPIIVSGT